MAKDAIQYTALSEDTCRKWIQQLLTGRSADGTAGRFKTLHDAIKERDKAFHAQNPPQFGPPFENMQTFQSDALRQAHQEFMTRLVEHPIRVHVKPPRDTQAQRDAAQKLATVLETGLELTQERDARSLLGMLGDGQLRHCYGVLHWYKRSDVFPDYPDPVELDAEPDERAEAQHYRKYRDDETPKREGAKYRETEDTLKERDKRARASAGFAYAVEVPRADEFAFVEDKGCPNGMGLCITIQTVGILDYERGIADEGFKLSIYSQNSGIHLYQEGTAPEQGEPSGDNAAWGSKMRIARIWTRDGCCELGALEQGEFNLLKSWKHEHKMPPFALAKAIELNEPDPLYAYPPYLLGMYRTKPDYDYERSLGRALAEQAAMRRYWIELPEGGYQLDGHGNKIVLSEDAASAFTLPPGAKLVSAELTIDAGFVKFLEMSGIDVEKATPPTGNFDISASTQPHTAVAGQQQANAPVAYLKQQEALAIRTMLRNIAQTESVGTESLVVMAKVKEGGGAVSGSLVEVKPEEIPGLDIDVSINPNSGAQEVATSEYYRGLLNDPKTPFTSREWLEKTGSEDPDRAIENWITEKAEMMALDRVVQQELARQFGDTFVLTPGGGVVDWQGQGVDPMAVLGSQGIQPPPPPPEPAMSGAPGVAPLKPLGDLQPMQQGAGGMSGSL